jgi:hypothetical protein
LPLLAEKVPITTSEVESQWWSTNPEPEKDFQARMQELLTQVRARLHVIALTNPKPEKDFQARMQELLTPVQCMVARACIARWLVMVSAHCT